MVRQAVGFIKKMPASAAEKADLFEQLATQITKHSGGSWTAARSRGADGSFIFNGEYRHALIIAPGGGVFRGYIKHIGTQFKIMKPFALQPIYSGLKEVQ